MTRRYRQTATEYMPQPHAGAPTVRGEVLIPLFHAGGVGGAVGIFVGVVVWFVARNWHLPSRELRHLISSWAVPVGLVVVCVATVVFILQQRPQRERAPVDELPESDSWAPPEAEPRTRVVVYEDPQGKQQRWVDLPVSDDKMRRVARAVLAGKNFSRPVLSDELSILTQGEYKKLAAALRKGRMLVLMADNHYELLAAGKRMLRRFM
ncbi:MAG TPA: hypothetical protein VM537_15650 [Anaerolineae bacterium]|nr:hypothetical protein [Anaerolineae bacterium]